MSKLYKEIYSQRTLYAAWRKVRSSAFFSTSEEIKREAEDFEGRLPGSILEIQRSLSSKSFVFLQQTGVAKRKSGGKPRPLVLAPIPNRVVQRALLDVLQTRVKFVKQVLAIPTSYGGIPSKRVAMAVDDAKTAIRNGARFHIRSDIPGFFTKIDKQRILGLLGQHIPCKDTINLFEAAISTDLANIDDLRRQGLQQIFPIGIEGVAQGSPLSPLLANIYLHDFDKTMNSGEVICLRYIDDFLILGKDSSAVDRAFNRSLQELKKLSLEAYDPCQNTAKASRGAVAKGFDFLGCRISPGLVQPSESSRTRFKQKLAAEFETVTRVLRFNAEAADIDGRYSYASALYRIDKIILGWGKAFAFCNGSQCLSSLDGFISKKLDQLEHDKAFFFSTANDAAKRRIIGVRLLAEMHLQNKSD